MRMNHSRVRQMSGAATIKNILRHKLISSEIIFDRVTMTQIEIAPIVDGR
jgi:hypothetical protein